MGTIRDVWFVSVIFVITLLGGSWMTSWSLHPGGVCVHHVEDDPSRFEDMLRRAATLESGTATTELEGFWSVGRFERALQAPENERDAFAAFAGRLEQVTSVELSPPGTVECFVRVPGSGPVIVLAAPDDLDDCAVSDQVVVEGWFHGVGVARARDGLDRRYPIFVARLRADVRSGGRLDPSLMVVVSCLGLAILWWIIRRRVGRPSSGGTGMASVSGPHCAPTAPRDDRDLPTDPVAALDELARRSDDSL